MKTHHASGYIVLRCGGAIGNDSVLGWKLKTSINEAEAVAPAACKRFAAFMFSSEGFLTLLDLAGGASRS